MKAILSKRVHIETRVTQSHTVEMLTHSHTPLAAWPLYIEPADTSCHTLAYHLTGPHTQAPIGQVRNDSKLICPESPSNMHLTHT